MSELKTEVVKGSELPYRVELDGKRGAATTPAGAVLAMLRVAGVMPHRMSAHEASAWLVLNASAVTPEVVEMCRILDTDSFEA